MFVVIGDGESNEGSVWEAALCASKHMLSNLTILIDYNKHQSYASTFEVMNLEPLADKWRSFGFEVYEVDGHDVEALQSLLSGLSDQSKKPGKPNAVICHTVKGKGVEFAENNLEWHHKSSISDEDLHALYDALEIGQ